MVGTAVQLVKTLDSIGDAFGLRDVPSEGIPYYNLNAEYGRLQNPKGAYVPEVAKGYLDIIEVNAGWFLFRELASCNNPDSCISLIDPKTRMELFIRELYRKQRDYYFFEDREKAIKNLDDLGVIQIKDYRPIMD